MAHYVHAQRTSVFGRLPGLGGYLREEPRLHLSKIF